MYDMMFPIIRIRNKGEKGKGRIVGTDVHDMLIPDKNGDIEYLDLQCMDGTGKDGSFEFVGKKDDMFKASIEFVDIDTLLKIYAEQTKMSCEAERNIRDFAKKMFDDYYKENDLGKDEGEISHS